MACLSVPLSAEAACVLLEVFETVVLEPDGTIERRGTAPARTPVLPNLACECEPVQASPAWLPMPLFWVVSAVGPSIEALQPPGMDILASPILRA